LLIVVIVYSHRAVVSVFVVIAIIVIGESVVDLAPSYIYRQKSSNSRAAPATAIIIIIYDVVLLSS